MHLQSRFPHFIHCILYLFISHCHHRNPENTFCPPCFQYRAAAQGRSANVCIVYPVGTGAKTSRRVTDQCNVMTYICPTETCVVYHELLSQSMLQCMSETIQPPFFFFLFTLKQTVAVALNFCSLVAFVVLFLKAVVYISEKLNVPIFVVQTQLCTMTAMVHLTYCISCLHAEVVSRGIFASANVVVVGFRK